MTPSAGKATALALPIASGEVRMLILLLLSLASIVSIAAIVAGATILWQARPGIVVPGFCARCGYPARGLPALDLCPECGHALPLPAPMLRAPLLRRRRALLGMMVMLAGIALPAGLLIVPSLLRSPAPAAPVAAAAPLGRVAPKLLPRTSPPLPDGGITATLPLVETSGPPTIDPAATDPAPILQAWSAAGLPVGASWRAARPYAPRQRRGGLPKGGGMLRLRLEASPATPVVDPRSAPVGAAPSSLRRSSPTSPLFPG